MNQNQDNQNHPGSQPVIPFTGLQAIKAAEQMKKQAEGGFTPEELVAQLLCAWREFFTTSDNDYNRSKAVFDEAQARTIAALRAVQGRGGSVPPSAGLSPAWDSARNPFSTHGGAAAGTERD